MLYITQSMAEEPPILGSDGLIVRDSGAWAADKLHYLQDYLQILSVGMKNQWPDKLYYVDLFAGPGRCRLRETNEEIDGSPLIALRFGFAKYFFFEADEVCYQALDGRVKKQFPEKANRVSIKNLDCNNHIDEIDPPEGGLGLAFIDPTGVSPLRFETIRKLAADRRVDLIINFHEGMGIRMNVFQYLPKEGTALDAFMGSQRWRKLFRGSPKSLDQVCKLISDEYRNNLRHLGYQVIDGSQIPIKTHSGALLYYLVFASKHPRGNEFWRKIQVIDAKGQRKLFS